MIKLTQKESNEALQLHKLWLDGDLDGVRADFSGKDLSGLSFAYASLKRAICVGTNFTGADFRGANFSGANCMDAKFPDADFTDAICMDANFSGADFHDATGDGKRIRTTKTDRYTINHHDDRCQIGCKNYSLAEWSEFPDDEIARMDTGALAWWKEWREFVLAEGKVEE